MKVYYLMLISFCTTSMYSQTFREYDWITDYYWSGEEEINAIYDCVELTSRGFTIKTSYSSKIGKASILATYDIVDNPITGEDLPKNSIHKRRSGISNKILRKALRADFEYVNESDYYDYDDGIYLISYGEKLFIYSLEYEDYIDVIDFSKFRVNGRHVNSTANKFMLMIRYRAYENGTPLYMDKNWEEKEDNSLMENLTNIVIGAAVLKAGYDTFNNDESSNSSSSNTNNYSNSSSSSSNSSSSNSSGSRSSSSYSYSGWASAKGNWFIANASNSIQDMSILKQIDYKTNHSILGKRIDCTCNKKMVAEFTLFKVVMSNTYEECYGKVYIDGETYDIGLIGKGDTAEIDARNNISKRCEKIKCN